MDGKLQQYSFLIGGFFFSFKKIKEEDIWEKQKKQTNVKSWSKENKFY